MEIIKNAEIARKYGVSKATVTRWLRNAEENRNDLILHKKGSRHFVINSTHNHEVMKQLSEETTSNKRKFPIQTITPKPELFDILSESEIGDILTSIEKYRFIPHKYTYYDYGAQEWADFSKQSFDNGLTNTVTNTEEILGKSAGYIKHIGSEGINFVDVGCGDALTVKNIILELMDEGLIKKYIAIDASKEILDIARNNVQEWTQGKLEIETYVRDIEHERFSDILFHQTNSTVPPTHNLVFVLGSTINNIDTQGAMKMLAKSLGTSDVLILGQTLESQLSKTYFDFATPEQTYRSELVPNLLGLSRDHYNFRLRYDGENHRRVGEMTFTVDCRIQIEHAGITKSILLKQNETMIVWKHYHHTMVDVMNMIDKSGLVTLSSMTSDDRSHVVTFNVLK